MLRISILRPAGLMLVLWLSAAAIAEQPLHVRATWKAAPDTQATISWETRSPGELHQVRYRQAGDAQWQMVPASRSGAYSLAASDRAWFYHHARLTALRPATRYELQCGSDGDWSPSAWLATAPNDDREFSLLVGGDSRTGIDDRRRMNHMISRMVAEQQSAGRPAIVALAHGGDFIEDGRNLDQWMAWLDDQPITSSQRQLLPVIPTRGNHDVGPLFNEVFDFPAEDRNWFTTTIGSTFTLVTLNTETATAGDQADWLAERLATLRPRYRWLLCQYHKPAFPAVKVPSGAYLNWVPLFEQFNIDLAMESDGHVIKRTAPLRNNQVDPTGIVYIGEGGLGVGQRTPKTSRWYLRDTAEKCGSGHHLHLLTFTPDRLTVRVVRLGGEVFDEFQLLPRNNLAADNRSE